MTMTLGSSVLIKGTVTTLDAIGASSGPYIEAKLGYQKGRLANGFSLLVLTEALTPDDFEFGGTTARPDGREGLSAESFELDKQRPRVNDRVEIEYGTAGYRKARGNALLSITSIGPRRIVKIIPIVPHDPNLSPRVQYPMGDFRLQWSLISEKRFFVAMTVDSLQIARTAEPFTAFLGTDAKYDDRRRILEYLKRA